MKVRSAWASGKGLRADPDGKQVRCLTADAGHVWIHAYDKLPPLVRKRLAESPFNLCAACMDIEAHHVAVDRGLRRPSLRIYFDTIQAIERELFGQPEGRSVVRSSGPSNPRNDKRRRR
jgi:hypothetical protein